MNTATSIWTVPTKLIPTEAESLQQPKHHFCCGVNFIGDFYGKKEIYESYKLTDKISDIMAPAKVDSENCSLECLTNSMKSSKQNVLRNDIRLMTPLNKKA